MKRHYCRDHQNKPSLPDHRTRERRSTGQGSSVADILLAVHDRNPDIWGSGSHSPSVSRMRTFETAVLMPTSVKVLFSALEEIRTPNLLIRSQML